MIFICLSKFIKLFFRLRAILIWNLSPIMSLSVARSFADPLRQFLGPETDTFYSFLAPEIVKMGQNDFWPQKLKLLFRQLFWPLLFFFFLTGAKRDISDMLDTICNLIITIKIKMCLPTKYAKQIPHFKNTCLEQL
jgi:hypothetical protein